MLTSIRAAILIAVVLLAAGCSSAGSGDAAETVPVPQGFEVPEGVTLTAGGTILDTGEPASVIYQVGDRAASAVTVTVKKITKGSIEDFTFFSLDDETKTSTPFYVDLAITNEGPAGLGGAAVPVYAHDSSNTVTPANDIVGSFKPCPNATLPESFLPGSSAELCLVFLIAKGRTLTSVDLQTGSAEDAIVWKP